jgi:hypothetical protein
MELIPVDSSSVRGIGYDEDRGVLYVQYVDGEVYEYFKVPKNHYIDLLNAKSIGWSVNKRIKPYYNFRKN